MVAAFSAAVIVAPYSSYESVPDTTPVTRTPLVDHLVPAPEELQHLAHGTSRYMALALARVLWPLWSPSDLSSPADTAPRHSLALRAPAGSRRRLLAGSSCRGG